MRPLTTLDRRALLKALSLAPSHAVRVPAHVEAELRAAGLICSQVCLLPCAPDAAGQTPAAALLRDDLVAGLPGLPMHLRLQVVSDDGAPLPGTRVDVWHQIFGREEVAGRQVADAAGCVQFRTVFPEAGPQGTAAIHLRLHLLSGEVAEATLAFGAVLSCEINQRHDGHATSPPQAAAPLPAKTLTPITPRITAPDGEVEVALVIGITRQGNETGHFDRILRRA